MSPGKYTVDAVAPADLKAPQQGDRAIGWVRTYYPSAADVTSAAIAVSAGGDIAGQDIRLKAMPLYGIRGMVTDDRGQPAAGASLKLVLDSNIHAKETQFASRKDGSFESPLVHAGGWRISAARETKS